MNRDGNKDGKKREAEEKTAGGPHIRKCFDSKSELSPGVEKNERSANEMGRRAKGRIDGGTPLERDGSGGETQRGKVVERSDGRASQARQGRKEEEKKAAKQSD